MKSRIEKAYLSLSRLINRDVKTLPDSERRVAGEGKHTILENIPIEHAGGRNVDVPCYGDRKLSGIVSCSYVESRTGKQ